MENIMIRLRNICSGKPAEKWPLLGYDWLYGLKIIVYNYPITYTMCMQ